MKKKKLYCVVFISYLLLASCAGLADYSLELPGNYSVVRTSAHEVTIARQTSDSSWGSNVISSKVTEVAWDDHYILVKQLSLMDDPNSSNGYQIPNEDDIYFWILEFNSGVVYGPFDEGDFIEKKKRLGISKKVILKEIENLQ